mmetsp:Transcript_49258/g.130825  ORF Transcript_49258/g.130825 Transcript_49258/m.130825 type:complete len:448 (-) Transcript_49258:2566-3909(-)
MRSAPSRNSPPSRLGVHNALARLDARLTLAVVGVPAELRLGELRALLRGHVAQHAHSLWGHPEAALGHDERPGVTRAKIHSLRQCQRVVIVHVALGHVHGQIVVAVLLAAVSLGIRVRGRLLGVGLSQPALEGAHLLLDGVEVERLEGSSDALGLGAQRHQPARPAPPRCAAEGPRLGRTRVRGRQQLAHRVCEVGQRAVPEARERGHLRVVRPGATSAAGPRPGGIVAPAQFPVQCLLHVAGRGARCTQGGVSRRSDLPIRRRRARSALCAVQRKLGALGAHEQHVGLAIGALVLAAGGAEALDVVVGGAANSPPRARQSVRPAALQLQQCSSTRVHGHEVFTAKRIAQRQAQRACPHPHRAHLEVAWARAVAGRRHGNHSALLAGQPRGQQPQQRAAPPVVGGQQRDAPHHHALPRPTAAVLAPGGDQELLGPGVGVALAALGHV